MASSDAGTDGEYSKAQTECQDVCTAIDDCKVYFVVALQYRLFGSDLRVYCEIGGGPFDASAMSSTSSAVFSVGYELCNLHEEERGQGAS
ncbi:uncharacterized protein PgNI_01984 [Pyricularia grisea]|uniref:Uncharacterized protein n=1 Tax=Pyricularia grisea TaxID=148305 RepID=A0A6P8BG47_PYRGI|nr:uncharacterized protein PgNI_01984 [Pyricularia grisea]TLD15627.1 hypothetical protein PgNI_01984 [Pyricularia grisea]